jgi:hypothetical protein
VAAVNNAARLALASNRVVAIMGRARRNAGRTGRS